MTTGTAGAPVAYEPPAIEPGTLLAFRYRLGARMASGNGAEAYRAQEEGGSRAVVVRLVRPSQAGEEGGTLALRLAEQAELLRRVAHPGTERLIADGWDEPLGARFVVLEQEDGELLESRLARGGLDVGGALSIAESLCEVLGELHGHGLLHLELSPSSVLLRPPGGSFPLRLPDVGSHRAGEAAGPPPSSASVLPYLAPERLRGEACDVRSDVHGVGAVLYRMLGKHAPFRGGTVAEVLTSRGRPVPPLFAAGSSPGDEADRASRRCLAEDPAGRFADVAALRAVLVGLRGRVRSTPARP